MIRRTLFLIAAFALLTATPNPADAASKNWYVRPWQASEGVTGSNIPGIVQTADGYLWIATDNGIVRFDGFQFQPVSLPFLSGSNRPKINVMAPTQAGGIVMAINRGGVVRMNPDSPPEVYNNPEFSLTAPVSVFEDSDASIWVSYHLGPVFHLQNGQVHPVGTDDGLPTPKLDCLFILDTKKNMWFMQGSFVGRVTGGKFSTVVRLSAPGGRIAPAGDGGVWISSGAHLLHCDDRGTLVDRGAFSAVGAIEPTALQEDHSGAVWIGTAYTGLFCFDGASFENVSTSHEHVYCLAEDRDGNVWVGTRGGGLDRVQPRTIVLEGGETGLPSASIHSICQDSNGVLWAVAQDGSLRKRTPDGWQLMSSENNWPGGTATCVVSDAAGGLYIGTRNGRLYYLKDGAYKTWGKDDGLSNRILSALVVAKNGDLWIAEQNADGLRRLRNGAFRSFPLPPQTPHIRAISEDASGNIWIGTDNGILMRVDGDSLVDETTRIRPAVDAIRCFIPSPDGALWIGTAHSGLARLKDGALSVISADQGLYDNVVTQMVSDETGWMWCAGPRGIFRVRLLQIEDLADGKTTHLQCVHYGEDQGLPNLEAALGPGATAIRTRDGRLWMLMGTALAIISPEKIRQQMQPPPVYIEKVSLDDHPVASYQGIAPASDGLDLRDPATLQLPANSRKLQFDFTAISFDAPDNLRIQYRLEGLEDNWQDASSQRNAVYSNLSPGDYHFHVRACNSDGVWNLGGANLALSVVPFFWQTLWFRLLGATFFTLLVALLVRYVSFRRLRTRLRVLEQQTALQKERARIARDLHDDLGARLTQIVMLSDMTLRENGNGNPHQRVTQIFAAAREVIKSLDETVWAVNPRNDSLSHLVDYIGQYAVEFLRAANIRCRVDLLEDSPDYPVSAEVRHNLLLVVKEALTNLVRHSGATEAWLRVKLTVDRIHLMIEDNGKGFVLPPAAKGQSEADGLMNMRHRMEEIGGKFEVRSDAGAGTRVSFIFPWSSSLHRHNKD